MVDKKLQVLYIWNPKVLATTPALRFFLFNRTTQKTAFLWTTLLTTVLFFVRSSATINTANSNVKRIRELVFVDLYNPVEFIG